MTAEHGPGLLLAVAGLSLFRAFNHPIFSTGVAPLLALIPREHSTYSGERGNRHRDTTPEWRTPARHGREGINKTRVKTLEVQRKPITDHRATGCGVFGIKRQVKSGLAEGRPNRPPCGLALPGRKQRFFDLGKTADHAAAAPETCADGNTSQNGGSPVPWISGIYASHRPEPSGKGNIFS